MERNVSNAWRERERDREKHGKYLAREGQRETYQMPGERERESDRNIASA
jgi:hypothetical protein